MNATAERQRSATTTLIDEASVTVSSIEQVVGQLFMIIPQVEDDSDILTSRAHQGRVADLLDEPPEKR
jgi:uncharacterized protein involved in exopolysaccharide biosynthesis